MSLRVSNISVARGGRSILDGVSFEAPRGRVTGLIGPNGAGKSTLLAAILALVPAQGDVRFDETDLLALPRRQRARLAAFVEQSAFTEERLSVRDVVGLGRIPHQSIFDASNESEESRLIEIALAQTGMTQFAERRFDTLSGGEQQCVHISRALAQDPKLLLLDEPSSHLDINAQLQLLSLLRRKADAGMTIVLALHDLNLAARHCDHLLVLHHGRVMAEGSPETVLTPALLRDVYDVEARLVPDADGDLPLVVLDGAVKQWGVPNSD